VQACNRIYEVLRASRDPSLVPFGSPFPSASLFPLQRLASALLSATRKLKPQAMVTYLPPGYLELRRHICRRYLLSGVSVPPEEIVITAGGMEAINLALRCVADVGDLVAVESPAFYATLASLERLGMKVVEVPTDAVTGVDIDALRRLLEQHPVKACCFMTNFQNPLGALMPDEKKRDLVSLLAEKRIPLIEDDVYAELYFTARPPKPTRAFDTQGLVLNCGSFSKCLAPGYRIGWVAAGRYAEDAERLKFVTNISTSAPLQAGIAAYLSSGGYDRHLRALRHTFAVNKERMLSGLRPLLSRGCLATDPLGGYLLWLEMPPKVDSLVVHKAALERGISVVPGSLFSPNASFSNCLRLNYGLEWTPAVDRGLVTLCEIVQTML
jgi:DNA-binding transcriptional MocR family regulator